jgi:hypothetical protein
MSAASSSKRAVPEQRCASLSASPNRIEIENPVERTSPLGRLQQGLLD